MTIYDLIKEKLEQHIPFRERRIRSKGLMILTLRDEDVQLSHKYNAEKNIFSDLTMEQVILISKKFDTYRHEHDAVQKDHEHLRGKDYPDGKRLAQERIMSYGRYEPGANLKLRI